MIDNIVHVCVQRLAEVRVYIHQKAPPERIQAIGEESRRPARVLEIEAIGVELCDSRGRDENTVRVSELDNVEGE